MRRPDHFDSSSNNSYGLQNTRRRKRVPPKSHTLAPIDPLLSPTAAHSQSDPSLTKHTSMVHNLAKKHNMLGMARMRQDLEPHTLGEDRRDDKIRKLEASVARAIARERKATASMAEMQTIIETLRSEPDIIEIYQADDNEKSSASDQNCECTCGGSASLLASAHSTIRDLERKLVLSSREARASEKQAVEAELALHRTEQRLKAVEHRLVRILEQDLLRRRRERVDGLYESLEKKEARIRSLNRKLTEAKAVAGAGGITR